MHTTQPLSPDVSRTQKKKKNLWWNNGWMKCWPPLYLFVDFSSVDSGVRYLHEAGRGYVSSSHDDWSPYVPLTLPCNSGVTLHKRNIANPSDNTVDIQKHDHRSVVEGSSSKKNRVG
jgi:hypothetical protein